MTCEEFATAGLDLGSAAHELPFEKAAREHLRECAHCAALQENWLRLREDLRALGAATAGAETPGRVEMRLRQEFLTKHRTMKFERSGMILGWSLAAAATLTLAVTGANWYAQRNAKIAKAPAKVAKTSPEPGASAPDHGAVLLASNGSGDFALLPDSMPMPSEDTTVVRVEMQRAALGALGLTVNEERAGDWIRVDLLVGDDGLPQAVRLSQASGESGN